MQMCGPGRHASWVGGLRGRREACKLSGARQEREAAGGSAPCQAGRVGCSLVAVGCILDGADVLAGQHGNRAIALELLESVRAPSKSSNILPSHCSFALSHLILPQHRKGSLPRATRMQASCCRACMHACRTDGHRHREREQVTRLGRASRLRRKAAELLLQQSQCLMTTETT